MKSLEEIFNDITSIGQFPNLIVSTQLPDKIYNEVLSWIEPCYVIKDDEYTDSERITVSFNLDIMQS